MWSHEGWGEIEATLRAQAGTSAASRTFVRFVAASAHPDQIDKQGRISVPQHLREHAGIDKEVVVIGAVTRAELWDPQRWAELKQTGDESLEELAAQMEL
jgi:MraZ protein